jgi:hypothetical protein
MLSKGGNMIAIELIKYIYDDLKSRGEHSISLDRFTDEGIIMSRHGKSTANFWVLDADKNLVCTDCRVWNEYSF